MAEEKEVRPEYEWVDVDLSCCDGFGWIGRGERVFWALTNEQHGTYFLLLRLFILLIGGRRWGPSDLREGVGQSMQ